MQLTGFKQLDDLLRGRTTHPDRISDGTVDLSLRQFILLVVLLGAIYGFFMGWFGITGPKDSRYMQLVASTIKLPALFLLTLVVTFPSLYVFNALIGCRLSFTATLRLLVASIAVNLAVAASFGPILGFFTLSTDSYSFMILLNVAFLAIAGFVGLGFLLQTLRRLASVSSFTAQPPTSGEPPVPANSDASQPSLPPPNQPISPSGHGPMERLHSAISESALGQSSLTFKIWVVIYGLVGAQMGWILRPFIGNPNQEFQWFRERQGNFFESVISHFVNLFTG